MPRNVETQHKWNNLLRYILNHQKRNRGATPATGQMMKFMGLKAQSTVRFHLTNMADAGLLRIISLRPMRLEVLTNPDEQPELPLVNEEPTVSMSKRATAKPRTVSFLDRAKCIARFVQDHWEGYGCPPEARDIAQACGYKHTNGISDTCLQMARLGWLIHEKRHHHDYELTALGREKLLGERHLSNDDVATLANPPEDEVVVTASGLEVESHEVTNPEGNTPEFKSAFDELVKEDGDELDLGGYPSADRDTCRNYVAMADSADIIFELIKRGYVVTKGW